MVIALGCARRLQSLRCLGAATGTVKECRRFYQSSKLSLFSASNKQRNPNPNHPVLFPNAFVHRRGDHPYGSREYLLVQKKTTIFDNRDISTNGGGHTLLVGSDGVPLQIVATLKAHRNIVFGAALALGLSSSSSSSSLLLDYIQKGKTVTLANTCHVLLRAALDDCSNDGEQAQAVCTLHGLSKYVQACLRGDVESQALSRLQSSQSTANVELEAVRAMATGVPRPGHSVVGQGTYRDGAAAWDALAREYVGMQATRMTTTDSSVERTATEVVVDVDVDAFVSEECQLYQAAGAQLVQIELLADTSPAYLASAGGAMARFFFL